MNILKLLGLAGVVSFAAQTTQAQCVISRAEIQDSAQCDTSVRHQILAVGYNAQGVSIWNNLRYQWNTGETSMSIFASAGNSYSVTITDANGCIATDAFTVDNSYSLPLVAFNVVQNACNTVGGGIVDVTVSGGTAPYSYYWSNGAFTQNVSGLTAGTHSLAVVDAAGCASYSTVQVSGLELITEDVRPSWCTANNGIIRLDTFYNTHYQYQWTNGATGAANMGLAPGWYGVTITDPQSGCTLVRQYEVTFDPSCETTISGHLYDITSSGLCVGNNLFNNGQSLRVRNTQTNAVQYVWSNQGYYEFSTRTPGIYEIEDNFFNGMVALCPASGKHVVTVTASGGSIPNQDFYASYPNGLEVNLDLWSWGARPGGSTSIIAYYCNHGTQAVSNATIQLAYDPSLSFVSSTSYPAYGNSASAATFVGNNTSTHTLGYVYSLNSGECAYISAMFDVPTTAQLGDVLNFQGTITPLTNDIIVANNTDTTSVTVVNSYDPNDKRAYPFRAGDEWNGQIFASDTKMEYIIRFQNTGNAPAIRVVVRDTLEADLLVETIRDVKMSHNGTLRAVGNALEFEFDNIYLVDSVHNEPESHGYIKFMIDRNPNLQLGAVVRNSAAIYFDFNAPVITNTATSTLFEVLAVAETDAAAINLRAIPNPFDKQINVQLELQNESPVRVSMINALGQTVRSVANNRAQTAGVHQYQIEADDLTSGMYWILVETNAGRYAHKIVKQ